MIRLLGILAGAALAVAVLILLVGLPEFPDKPEWDVPLTAENNAPPTMAEVSGQDAPPEAKNLDVAAASSRDQSGQDAPPTFAEVSGQDAPPTMPEVSGQDAPATMPDVSAQDAFPEAEDLDLGAASSRDNPNHWYAFWSPFRSEIAANGFVSQLQRTTGLDYRVVKLKPGVYEVAFAYSDDADVESKLAQISAATGLNIPES